MLKMFVLLLFILPVNSYTQDLADIKGMTRVHVIADVESRGVIAKELSKIGLKSVSEDSADFFIEYKELSREQMMFAVFARGQLEVFTKGDARRVLWAESATGGGYKGDVARQLSKKLRSAFKKLK